VTGTAEPNGGRRRGPGLGASLRSSFSRETAGKDLSAGLVLGLESVPDGLAAGLLAGVNPVSGLYGYLVGTVAGAFATSSVFMSVQATGAMAVIIADVPQVREGPDAATALFTLAVLTGVVMLLVGALRLGSLVRFVPNAVLTGFVNAVAVNIVLGQLTNLTGYAGQGPNRVARTIDTFLHVTSFHWQTVAVGALTVLLIVALERTRLGPLGLVAAIVAASAVVPLLGWDAVAQLNDVADIPDGLPTPVLPSLSLVVPLLVPAVSLAFVGLVQGAAISQSVPNPDGTYPDASGDFRGQGIANIAAGLFQGMPVGGSMSATALVTTAGARTRLANISAAVVMAVVILLFGDLAGAIAMPALAGLLMVIGVRTFKPDRVRMVWRTGGAQAIVMVTTFVLTIVIPLQYAVLIGVAMSVILFVAHQSNRVTVVRWVFPPGTPFPREEPAPAELPPGEVVVLMVYGSVFFASAQVVEAQLPAVSPGSTSSVVVLRLRGKEDLGSTFIRVITRYADTLHAAGGHLLLAGVGEPVLRQLTATGALDVLGPENVFPATRALGTAVTAAITRANDLLTAPPC
jgi:SulP family sulfate permease